MMKIELDNEQMILESEKIEMVINDMEWNIKGKKMEI